MGKRGFSASSSTIALVALLLTGRRITVAMIQNKLDINEAAARRYFHAMATLPGVQHERLGARRGLKLLSVVPRPAATPSDVAAACLVSSLASTLPDERLKASVARLGADVVAASRQAQHAEHLGQKFWFVARGGEVALPRRTSTFADVIEAVLASKHIEFNYQHFDGRRERRVRVKPLSLVLHEHQFYVVAKPTGGPLRAFRFSRITRLRLGGKFEYPSRADYNVEDVFRHEFGVFSEKGVAAEDVCLRLDRRWQHYAVSHSWHDTQHVTAQEDGTILLSLQVRVSPELRRWILGFGAEAEVIRPHALRNEIAAELGRGASRYPRRMSGTKLARRRQR